eukprot:c16273_g1_i2 orf=185-1915(+)
MQLRRLLAAWIVAQVLFVVVGAIHHKRKGGISYFDWKIQYANFTRLCHNKTLVSVNGQFPGPTAYVREGDTVIVNVTNLVSYNVTIHWHGVRQLLSAWADGPAYVTQCPLQTGRSYVHKFRIIGQRGTLFWHAHFSWLRATVYGAFIILPKRHVVYPFIQPSHEVPIVLGEWWNANTEDIISQALATGAGYQISDALTINGQPGILYNCSQEETFKYNVRKGKRYLLRVINAALNFQLYFGVANHTLTVVESDAEYTKQFKTDVIKLAPGESMNVVLTTDQPIGQYYMAASIFSPAPVNLVPFPQTPATAILSYHGANLSTIVSPNSPELLPEFPAFNDSTFYVNFSRSLKSRGSTSGYYYMDVPMHVDEDLLYTVGYAHQPCLPGEACPIGFHLATSINNITFKSPTVSLLQAYYYNISGVYDPDFPGIPEFQYNYTGVAPANEISVYATKVKVLAYGAVVQIVFQDTSSTFFESHPIHLHGQNFYVVGLGFGTYNSTSDPANFNLRDPPSKNTIAVPSGGWAAVRFRAVNPGVWYMHCHLDIHNSWGMATAFIVKNGIGKKQTLPPPPSDLPPC